MSRLKAKEMGSLLKHPSEHPGRMSRSENFSPHLVFIEGSVRLTI